MAKKKRNNRRPKNRNRAPLDNSMMKENVVNVILREQEDQEGSLSTKKSGVLEDNSDQKNIMKDKVQVLSETSTMANLLSPISPAVMNEVEQNETPTSQSRPVSVGVMEEKKDEEESAPGLAVVEELEQEERQFPIVHVVREDEEETLSVVVSAATDEEAVWFTNDLEMEEHHGSFQIFEQVGDQEIRIHDIDEAEKEETATLKQVMEQAQLDLKNAQFAGLLGPVLDPLRSVILTPALDLSTNLVPAVAEKIPLAET
eukprot:scaffold8973_cov78-Cylindrotheca_fusiformis.AAC.1